MDRERLQKAVIIAGLITAVIGLGFHLSVPGVTRSGYPIFVGGHDHAVESIRLELGASEYSFGIDLLGPSQVANENFSVYLLDSGQFAEWSSGTPIDEAGTALQFDVASRARYEEPFTSTFNRYIIIFNFDDNEAIWSYYYVALPPSFYLSLTIGFSGVFITLAGLGWRVTGWKRYFLAGSSVNLVLFFLRTFTLATYSLGLPDIFLELVHVELYNDYQFFYLSWVPKLLEGVWPYSMEMFYYLYPPLWIYTVAILGSVPSWLPGIPLFVFNIATGVLVYKTTLSLSGEERRSIYAMLVYLLNPLTLFYGSFMWLNPTPYVFFVACSFYLALEEKSDLSIAALAIATLYKQLAVVFFPLLVIAYIKKEEQPSLSRAMKTFFRSTSIYAGLVVLVSLPFLIGSAEQFLNQMIFWNTGVYERLIVFIPDLSMTVHLGSFFLWIGAPVWLTDVIAFLLINYVFLILSGIVVYGLYATYRPEASHDIGSKYRKIITKGLFWAFIAVLCVQFFYPRGAYKFYLLALCPFFAILFDYKNLDLQDSSPFKLQKHHLLSVFMALIVFLCFRFVYFWILAAWGIIYLWKGGELGRIAHAINWRGRKNSEEIPSVMSVWEEIYSDE
ncbi:MAG: hypothetical protein EAX95_03535 [Candidatus Thorarchaeota archaeon]|nr:hypothetical protein [Candidatus Thorarchaeota archaeon]